MEPLSILLAAAVAKAVFKVWFKDNEFLESAGDSVADIVTKVVPDWRAKSAAVRQLERIADRAAESFEPFLGYGHLGLSSNDVKAATRVVAEAIEVVNPNAKLLAEISFDPTPLGALIVQSLAVAELNTDSVELATSLSLESAELIVDLSSAMPEFHRETYAEILKRESDIIERLDSVFSELNNIREYSDKSGEDAARRFESAYRRTTARNLDQLELFGLDTTTRASSRQHNLTTAYISLSVVDSGSSESDGELVDTNSIRTMRAEEAAAISPLVVIKGEAGSGKTTLLQSLAVRSATAAFDESMEDWNDLLPFFVRLRALTSDALPKPEDFPSLVAPSIAGLMPDHWVHDQLELGRGLILIDGLDEISNERRDLTRKWVTELIESFPQSRVVITTRPPAVPDGWLASKGFTELELLPMSPDDVESFIDHWHQAVTSEEHDLDKRLELEQLSDPLKNRIKSDRALIELAATPLLCAMLCAMNRDRRQVLPTNRIALYEAAVHMIIHARDEQRRIIVDDLPKLDFETKLTLLQDIAFWMMQNGWSMVDRWRLVEFVESRIQSLTRVPTDASGDDVVNSLLLRSGLLRSPIDGRVDFIHNAFKEYLCAKGVIASDQFGFLEKQLSHEAWREVAVLAAAMADDVRRSEFIRNLLQHGDASSARRSVYHLLAVRCLETCTQLDRSLQEEIKKRLKGLHAPRNVSEARALSAAGDLAIPLVIRKPNQYARTAAACVRTLRLIGTPAALDALEAYGPDRRATVTKELLAAWPYFDRSEYASRILSQTAGVRGHLYLDNVNFLEAAGYLTNVTSIYIGVGEKQLMPSHYAGVNSLSSLNSLTITSNGNIEFDRLSNLRLLESLRLYGYSVGGADAVCSIETLRSLAVSVRTDLLFSAPLRSSDLHFIELSARNLSLPNEFAKAARLRRAKLGRLAGGTLENVLINQGELTHLEFTTDDAQRDIDAIRNCPSIRFLHVRDAGTLRTLDSIDSAPDLIGLWVHHASSLEDIRGARSLQKLQTLVVTGAESLVDLSAISQLPDLKTVYLDVGQNAEIGSLLDSAALSIGFSSRNISRAQDMGFASRLRSRPPSQGWS